ncbi:hypothetical protein Hbl1158_16875 (plasmid) [Halobaculum sp. CBA1158]|uniref:hypothetical protein n=1 Tax=Halobaculum sp. CBA1158 TaxID=2904243 RepID=UPI001F17BB2B|nr:hypothetical protein [Halobaculum sp. CBA1158]UIP01728.1 hypothetical protein Hbl1158_16875 [Halobaculum sp. CBA1158]
MTSETAGKDEGEAYQKVLVNRKFGGFRLSDAALDRLVREHGFTTTAYDSEGEYEAPDADIIDDHTKFSRHYGLTDRRSYDARTDDAIIQVVEELGKEASGRRSKIVVAEVPVDVDWYIDDYDGVETIREKHRTWPGREIADGRVNSDG